MFVFYVTNEFDVRWSFRFGKTLQLGFSQPFDQQKSTAALSLRKSEREFIEMTSSGNFEIYGLNSTILILMNIFSTIQRIAQFDQI